MCNRDIEKSISREMSGDLESGMVAVGVSLFFFQYIEAVAAYDGSSRNSCGVCTARSCWSWVVFFSRGNLTCHSSFFAFLLGFLVNLPAVNKTRQITYLERKGGVSTEDSLWT